MCLTEWCFLQVGSPNTARISSRIGKEYINVMNMLLLTLPGTPVTYYGEEIGMENIASENVRADKLSSCLVPSNRCFKNTRTFVLLTKCRLSHSLAGFLCSPWQNHWTAYGNGQARDQNQAFLCVWTARLQSWSLTSVLCQISLAWFAVVLLCFASAERAASANTEPGLVVGRGVLQSSKARGIESLSFLPQKYPSHYVKVHYFLAAI